jgi:hypothetical protein
LHSLTLEYCSVQPQALVALTQLRALSLGNTTPLGDATHEELLRAVSQLTLLAELCWQQLGHRAGSATAPAAGFTALTASSNLCSLQLRWGDDDVPPSPVLFQPGVVHPHLRVVELSMYHTSDESAAMKTISEDQLQLLCSCYPALRGLSFVVWPDPTPTALLPLLQLPALTRLGVDRIGTELTAAVGVAVQLTGLKELRLRGLLQKRDLALLQLTTLTALETLELCSVWAAGNAGATCVFWNKVSTSEPAGLWMGVSGMHMHRVTITDAGMHLACLLAAQQL